MMLSVLLALALSGGPPAADNGRTARVQPVAGLALAVPEKTLSTPEDATRWAHEDIASLPPGDQVFQRYVWNPDGSREVGGCVNYAANTSLSQVPVIIRPVSLVNGRLLRYDLRKLAIDAAGLARLIELWEELRLIRVKVGDKEFVRAEPYFLVLKDTLVRVPSAPYKATNGRTYDYRTRTERDVEYGLHVDVNAAMSLSVFTGSKVPIVRADYFCTRVLTQLDGGLYYQFLGVDRDPDGLTAQEDFLIRFGGADQDAIRKLRSDERAVQFRSNVTGKGRAIDVFYGSGVRPSVGVPICTVTHDMQDGDGDPTRHPSYSLIDFAEGNNDRAREIIVIRPQGMLAGALFDNKGALVDSVPDNIAIDRTIPAPYTARLEPMMSCLSCHLPHDGFIPFKNDAQTLLKKLDALGENVRKVRKEAKEKGAGISDKIADQKTVELFDTINRLAGLYSGDLNFALDNARNTHENATFRATGGMKAKEVGTAMRSLYHGYRYTLVSPQTALRECFGVLVPAEQAHEVFEFMVPRLPADIDGLALEDPTIGALRDSEYDKETKSWSLEVGRIEFERVFPDICLRGRDAATVRALQQPVPEKAAP